MAESIIIFLIPKLTALVSQEYTLLPRLKTEIQYISDELQSMHAFLRIAEAKQDAGLLNDVQKVWYKQVMEVASDIEDVVDRFFLHFSPQKYAGFRGCVRHMFTSVKNSPAGHQMLSKISVIKDRVEKISARRQKYEWASETSSTRDSEYPIRGHALLIKEADALLESIRIHFAETRFICPRTMSRVMLDALDIDNETRGWTCIVEVVEKHPVLLKKLPAYPFQRRYHNLLLTDMKGTKVKAIIFDNDIDFFARSFKPFSRYRISNALVVLQHEMWRQAGYGYTWFINSRTPVELIEDNKLYTLPCTFDVCNFRDIHKFAESDTNIAIKALVVHAFPTGDIDETKSVKNYVVVNEEGIPMVLRLWQDLLADYVTAITNYRKTPVTIIASNLVVKTFHGLSLATRKNTYIIQDPPLPETMEPKIWYGQNKALVDEWIKMKAYENNCNLFPLPAIEDILDMDAAMEAFKTVKTAWIRSKVSIAPSRFPFYEIICANCRMIVHAEVDWKIKCSGCMVMSPLEVRFNIPVTLSDGDNSIRSRLKSPDAEKLTNISAAEFKMQEDEGLKPTTQLMIEMDYTEIVSFVKYYDKEICGQMHRRYVILKTYTLPEMKTSTHEQTDTVTAPVDDQVDIGKQTVGTENASENISENQLFTPSTKDNLKEATVSSKASGSSATNISKVKRTITFGTITEAELNKNAEDAAAAQRAPTKKNKATK